MRFILWGLVVVTVFGFFVQAAPVARWTFESEEERAQWATEGLWRFVEVRELANEPSTVRTFPSGSWAAYFGIPNPTTKTGSYNTGWREQGWLRSPSLEVGTGKPFNPGDRLRLELQYCREVESYSGKYDITACYIFFRDEQGRYWDPENQVWQSGKETGVCVLYLDSSTRSEKKWGPFKSQDIQIPTYTREVQVAFYFDTVDELNNNFLGWLIDNVELYRVPAPLSITTEKLPEGRVGKWYWASIEASGGEPPYTWTLSAASKLPKGLVFKRPRDEGFPTIEGFPEESGTFPIEVVVTDRAGTTVKKSYTLIVNTTGNVAMIYWRRDFSDAGSLDDCDRTGLWHWAVVRELGTGGAYYAVPGQGNYDTGRRNFGALTLPEITLPEEARGQRLWLALTHTWEVEYFLQGSYDQLSVQVAFLSNGNWSNWETIWSKDSREGSPWSRMEWSSVPFDVPRNAEKLRIRFFFDTMDGLNNRYRGWFIRSVVVLRYQGPLTIITPSLPPGEVGLFYSHEMTAEGGLPPYQWVAEGLPSRLTIDRNTGRIQGVPEVGGTFTVRITVSDRQGNSVAKNFSLFINPEQVTLFDDADFSPDRWAFEDLWTVTEEVRYGNENIAQGRGVVAYYGRPGLWTYETGVRTKGALTSMPFSLGNARYVSVSFEYWREVESYDGAYDQTYLQIRFGSGDWQTIWYRDSRNPSEKAWTSWASPGITVPSGATTMQIRFVFDSVDRYNNRYLGWVVDKVRVRKVSQGGAVSSLSLPSVEPREKLEVLVVPNPVRDVHTATFVVHGITVERMKVEIYDLSGRRVWEGEALGNELLWHTQDLSGLPLANGVYLYRVVVEARGRQEVVQGKVVILR